MATHRTRCLYHDETEPDSFAALAIIVAGAKQNINHFHNDTLGMPQEAVSQDGQISWSASFKAWGRKIDEGRASIEEQQVLRFPGQYEDEETGLYYNLHRYYDPDCGRYITEDPLGLGGGLNPYSYAPNPIGWTDPLGLTKCRFSPTTAADEIAALPSLCNQRPCDIRKMLRRRKYQMVGSHTNPTGANTGGQVWTKSMPDGNTASVRIDPPEAPTPAKNADQVPHAHKEVVPSSSVANGNYGVPKVAGTTLCNDAGVPTAPSHYKEVHIEIRQGRLITRPPKLPKI